MGKVINWKKCIGLDVRFIYDDIEGSVKIIDYIDGYVEIDYNGRITKTLNSIFARGG